jgi:hypothetical protein
MLGDGELVEVGRNPLPKRIIVFLRVRLSKVNTPIARHASIQIRQQDREDGGRRARGKYLAEELALVRSRGCRLDMHTEKVHAHGEELQHYLQSTAFKQNPMIRRAGRAKKGVMDKDCYTACARRRAGRAEREPTGELLEGLLHRGKGAMHFL